jgi:hypothetical protein
MLETNHQSSLILSHRRYPIIIRETCAWSLPTENQKNRSSDLAEVLFVDEISLLPELRSQVAEVVDNLIEVLHLLVGVS